MSKLEQILKAKKAPATLDDLSSAAGTSGPETQAALTLLELTGKVKGSGGRYEWIRATKPAPKPIKARAPHKVVTSSVQGRHPSSGTFAGGQNLPKGAYEVTVCAKRWRDRKTGRWLESPRKEFKPRKLKGETPDKFDDGITLYRSFTQTRYGPKPRAYRAEYPVAREAYKRRELGAFQVAEIERDIAQAVFEQELEDYQRFAAKVALDNAHRTGAAGKRDTVRKMSKRPKLLNSKNTKTPDQLRTEKIRLETKGRELTRKILSARAPKSRATLETQYVNNTRRLSELSDKAKRQGVNL